MASTRGYRNANSRIGTGGTILGVIVEVVGACVLILIGLGLAFLAAGAF